MSLWKSTIADIMGIFLPPRVLDSVTLIAIEMHDVSTVRGSLHREHNSEPLSKDK